ncbi:MAG: MMPL family transporter [Candidatus Eisenbacteria bacterium]|nr:MMPL family transporter [Candidatus Eisenbacteria bacterium]
MILPELSIKRPVFATVISLVLVTFGVISYQRLSLREYPDIDRPNISVSTSYQGAAANVVESRITQIIEGAVSSIEGLKSVESSSSDGYSRVSLEFDIDRDIDEAANDVRDRVSRVVRRLPDEADAPRISKWGAGGGADLIIGIRHPTMSQMELTDYAERHLIDRFSIVDGVASARVFGGKRYSMRVWLDRRALAARGLTVQDVESALRTENVELPAGRLESVDREFSIRLERGFRTAEDFRRLVVDRGPDGYLVRLDDVADVEIAPEDLRDSFTAEGQSAVGIGVSRQSTANTLSVISGVKAAMEEMRPQLPEGMELIVLRDSSVFIEAAIDEVRLALLIACALVIGIIFLFLGSGRAALVPAVTVPISLISAFIVLYAFGFSVNLLTSLALVLAIGLLVDDSIVVLENIHRRIEDGEPPLLAAFRGANEVAFAVIATTLVLVAVFVPISLMGGETGRLFTEFAFAITGAVVFSSIVALTLSPMLCSKVLRPRDSEAALIKTVDGVFRRIVAWYERALRLAIRNPVISLAVLILILGSIWVMLGTIVSEYEPSEDRGTLFVRMSAPEGTGFDASREYMERVTDRITPLIARGEAQHVIAMTPGWGAGGVNHGTAIADLAPWADRERSADQIARELSGELSDLIGVRVFVFQPSGLSFSWGQPIQFVIGGPTYEDLARWRDIIVEKAKSYPGLVGVDADYKETTPQLRVEVDKDRAAELGVSSQTVGRTLESMLGSRNVTTFVDRGEEYNVVLQGAEEERRTPTDLENIYVRSSRSGELIPLANLVSLEERAEASELRRYNRMRAVTISAGIADGYSMGQCLAFLEEAVREELPASASIGYKGLSEKLKESSGAVAFVFIIALIIAYLVLSAQFESFVSPFVIMLTVPMGMIGATVGMLLMGVTLNIFSQIGLIMLIGLAAKNGILIVEFTNQLRDRGLGFEEAVFRASRLRLRPILMTGLSTAIGALPLILASGAGAASRLSLGTVVAFGATSACLLTLFVVPVGYYYLCRRQASPREMERRLAGLRGEHEDRV